MKTYKEISKIIDATIDSTNRDRTEVEIVDDNISTLICFDIFRYFSTEVVFIDEAGRKEYETEEVTRSIYVTEIVTIDTETNEYVEPLYSDIEIENSFNS